MQAAGDASPPRVGSIDLLEALAAAHPGVRWSWVLGALLQAWFCSGRALDVRVWRAGADTFADLRAGRWKRSGAFMQRVHLFVVARPGQPQPDVAGCEQVRLLARCCGAAERARWHR